MELKGKWKVAKVLGMDEDLNPVWLDEEGFKKSPAYDPEDPDAHFSTCYFFNEDGTVGLLMKIPEGVSKQEIDEAVASGEVTVIDGMMLAKDKDPIEWKEENGTFYINYKDAGDPENPWSELIVEDGLIELMVYKLAKAE